MYCNLGSSVCNGKAAQELNSIWEKNFKRSCDTVLLKYLSCIFNISFWINIGNDAFLSQAHWKPYISRGYSQFKNVLCFLCVCVCDINDLQKGKESKYFCFTWFTFSSHSVLKMKIQSSTSLQLVLCQIYFVPLKFKHLGSAIYNYHFQWFYQFPN